MKFKTFFVVPSVLCIDNLLGRRHVTFKRTLAIKKNFTCLDLFDYFDIQYEAENHTSFTFISR